MTVAKLRHQLLSFADRELDADPAGGTVQTVADALGRFGDMSLGAFAGLLGKVRIPAPKAPRKPKKDPEQLAREKADKERQARERSEQKAADKARKDQEKAEQKRLAAEQKAAEKVRVAREQAEQKRLAKEQKDREKAEPTPEIRRVGAELTDLIERSKRERATYAEIDEHVERLKALTKPQLLQVAKLINSDAGLSAKPKGEIVKKLGDTLRRVLGTAERVKM